MRITYIEVETINPDKVNDFLNEQSSHSSSFASQSLTNRLSDRSIFFRTNTLTISEDHNSNLFVFFEDSDGGISAAVSSNFGVEWHYYYGIVEKISGIECKYPFAVTNFPGNNCYLFFSFKSKILCKKIPMNLFKFEDANLIERFSDIFEEGDPPKENPSIYSREGKILRRSILSSLVAGDMTDSAFLEILGKDAGETEYDYTSTEVREIEGEPVLVRKNPIVRTPSTVFNNYDITNMFFSAYRKDNGEMRFFYMAPTNGTGDQLQCHFSLDDGQSWYDFWEFIEYGYNRFRYDPDKNSQFIDRNASGDVPNSKIGTDPQNNALDAGFGINIHWSRLSRHKVSGGEGTINDESEVLTISSPYLFYQSTTDKIFLFYIYQDCLLCKVFNDEVFTTGASRRGREEGGMSFVKQIIERETKSYFIDGSLSNDNVKEEIEGATKNITEGSNTISQILTEGNIVFRYPFASNNFGENRRISSQRICAYDMPTGFVRVFYKHSDSLNLKSALWNGREWWAEDFLRESYSVSDSVIPDHTDYVKVTGGFGNERFT